MNKSLLSILVFFALCIPTQAQVVIDYRDTHTAVDQRTITRSLLVNNDDGAAYDIAVRPADTALTSSNGNVSIPLENVYINNTREDVYLRFNEYSNLFAGLNTAQNMTAKIRDFGMVPAGIYSLQLEIQATNTETQEVNTSFFNLQFDVPVIQDINLNSETPKIVVNATDAFNTQKKIANEISPRVQINSNTNWVLLVKCDDFGIAKGNYYIRTISATPNVSERLQERVLLEPNREIIIARGSAPADNESVTVEFSLASADGKFLPAGSYENRIRYILREER